VALLEDVGINSDRFPGDALDGILPPSIWGQRFSMVTVEKMEDMIREG